MGKGDRGDEVFVINFWERRVRGRYDSKARYDNRYAQKSDRKAEK